MSEKNGQIYICSTCLRQQHRQYLLSELPGLRVKTECHYCHKTRRCYLINPAPIAVQPIKPQDGAVVRSLQFLICPDCQETKHVPVIRQPMIIDFCLHCRQIKPCYEIDFKAIIMTATRLVNEKPRVMSNDLFTKWCPRCQKKVKPSRSTGGIITEFCPYCHHEIRPQIFGR